VALIWEDDAGDETRHVTYAELKDEVCKFANVLKAQGAKKGTVVTIYMPMVPEAVVAMQACARIGAIHSVVFSAFSADNLAGRVNDSASEIIITADGYNHRGKNSILKPKADEAAAQCPSVKKLIVLRRSGEAVDMQEGRDVYWQDETENASTECEPEVMDAEDPLFLLYTSGSTGKPKGVLHTTAGYLLYTHMTMKYIFDVREDDVFWCTADVGWITGHSYLCYGPLSNCAQCVMFEGVPTYPEPDRFWRMVDDHKVTIFYTAPGRRTDQPRSLDVVPRRDRQRKLPDHRHLVADRNRRPHDHDRPRRTRDQTRLRRRALPRCENRDPARRRQ